MTIIQGAIIWGAIFLGSIILGDNCLRGNNPRGNHPWGNCPGVGQLSMGFLGAIILEPFFFDLWSLSLEVTNTFYLQVFSKQISCMT